MLRFVQRLNHRNAVRGHLDAMLMMYPRKRQFERDFPSLKQLIREDFEKGILPASSAVTISAGIITSLLEQLNDTERSAVAQSLEASDPDEIEKLAERRIGGERDQRGEACREQDHMNPSLSPWLQESDGPVGVQITED